MLLQGQPRKSSDFCKLMFEEKFDGKNNQTKDKHKNTDAVDAMHIAHPFGRRLIGVSFLNIQVLRYLS